MPCAATPPIPGTRKLGRLEENLGAVEVELTQSDLREIEAVLSKVKAQGERLPEEHMKLIDHAA
jgi:aryl-alcohol dehydrogenase-like predicted oxidoreductase